MNRPDQLKNDVTGLNRRRFMQVAAGLSFAIGTGGLIGACAEEEQQTRQDEFSPNAWLTVHADDRISIIAPAPEMGQGSGTALPIILGEELDADFARIEMHVPAGRWDIYGNPVFGGILYTGGSMAVAAYYPIMRKAGAQARKILMQAAADEWGVPLAEVTTEPNTVVHSPSGRKFSYGEVAAFARAPAVMPQVSDSDLKNPDDFRMIGYDQPRLDVPEKTDGTALYSMDVQLPGMVYASVLHTPVEGESPVTIDDSKTRAVNGVIDVVSLPDGVAVVGETVEATMWGKDALSVEWSNSSAAQNYDSAKDLDRYSAQANDLSKKGVPWREVGNVETGLSIAERIYEFEYKADYVYHAQMEPLNAVARFNDDGKVEVWVGTQTQTLTTFSAAAAAGIPMQEAEEKVILHPLYLGGGFGRRSGLEQQFMNDAIRAAKAVGRPVKVIWSREDDVKRGQFRPMVAQKMRAGLDGDGNIIAWNHRVAGASVLEFFNNVRWKQTNQRDVISMLGSEIANYEIPNIRAEHIIAKRGARVAPWRSVATGYTVFAVESFVDEIADAEGIDPLEMRRRLAKSNPRVQTLLDRVAEMSDWGKPRENSALGLAFTPYHESKAAGVAEIALDDDSGEIRVLNFWTAVDCGRPVQPDNIHAQIEGAVIFGLSHALKERITVENGRVQQSNFYDYNLMRMADIPDIHIEIVANDHEPSGIGELGLPMTGPAVANAFFTLTGKRLRHLPLTPDRVSEALTA